MSLIPGKSSLKIHTGPAKSKKNQKMSINSQTSKFDLAPTNFELFLLRRLGIDRASASSHVAAGRFFYHPLCIADDTLSPVSVENAYRLDSRRLQLN